LHRQVENRKLYQVDFLLVNDILINDKQYVRLIQEVMNDDHNHQNNEHVLSLMVQHYHINNDLMLMPYHFQRWRPMKKRS
jgi:RNA processing factor Prp31